MMSYFIYLCTTFFLFFQVCNIAYNADYRIIFIMNTTFLLKMRPGEFPYQISLFNLGIHHCGGSILNEKYVLTAAHCVSTNFLGIFKVIAGTTNVKNLSDTATVHKVTEIHLHEDYDKYSSNWNNDITLLKVDPPYVFNKYVAPAKLPHKNEPVYPQQGAVVSGFGKTAKNGSLSPKLLKTTVSVVDLKHCQIWHKEMLNSTNVCAGNAFDDTGFCNGDSGGPLTANGKVVGIVSFALYGGCSHHDYSPQVYIKVSAYIDWISNHMDKNAVIHH